MRGKRRRAERRLEEALDPRDVRNLYGHVDARLPSSATAFVAVEAIPAGSHVQIEPSTGGVSLVREPVGPRCPWCGTPVEQRGDSSQARCGCGLP